MEEVEIKEYFSKHWNQTEIDPHVVRRLESAKNPIDVGCGFNAYKKFNENLIGVDIVNEEADVICDILDFPNEGPFDLAICYGILHFNSYDWIRARLEWVLQHTTDDAEILMKVNPCRKKDLKPENRSKVVFFDRWNRGLADHFAEVYNLEVWNWREWRLSDDNSLRYKFDFRRVNHGLK